tara:strand:+ start:665 stop:1546 length:882 start_codon:yes stop_codon:yes gene_type:complete
MVLLTFANIFKIMNQSPKAAKIISSRRADLLQIYKDAIVKKKLPIKDTPENRKKFQTILLRGLKKLNEKKVVVVPDQAKGAIKQKDKNLTAYGKEANKAEPDTIKKAAIGRDWTIITDNCYGVAYMKALNKPYESPFFSMYIYAPDYLTLLENFDEYMKITPTAQTPAGKSRWTKAERKYPVLLLKGSKGPVEIHMAHEKQSPEEAIRKWTSRKGRMNMNKADMYVKMDSRDKFSVELGKRFLALKQFPHKRLFVSQKYKDALGSLKDVTVMDYKTMPPIGTKTEKLYPVPAK